MSCDGLIIITFKQCHIRVHHIVGHPPSATLSSAAEKVASVAHLGETPGRWEGKGKGGRGEGEGKGNERGGEEKGEGRGGEGGRGKERGKGGRGGEGEGKGERRRRGMEGGGGGEDSRKVEWDGMRRNCH